jgi:hypothetical protein
LTPLYLQGLVSLREQMEVAAQYDLNSIAQETRQACHSTAEEEEANAFFQQLAFDASRTSLEKVVRLLVSAQEKQAIQAYVQWFWNIGGLRKSFGILTGNLQGRRSWRYSISDDLLATLVQLSLVEQESRDMRKVKVRRQIRLRDFLVFLEQRFGLLIDRPPPFLDSAAARAAARENFEALKRRLRQMGYFQELSDDFTAQYIRDPLRPAAIA